MLDNVKKYWFVIIIGLVFVVFIGLFSADQINSVLKGKKVDGKEVVAEIKNENYFVDDYFKDLQASIGDGQLYSLFQKSVLRSIETPEDVVKSSKENAEALLNYTAQNEGQAGVEEINAILISMGYSGTDELNLYYEDMAKYNVIIKEYALANKETVLDPYVKEAKPRLVSHILISMDDPKKPTEAQQSKIDEVNKRIANGEKFADIATALSDDQASAVEGGSVGYTDYSTQFVEEFLKAALATEQGKLSEWVNTNYGRHIIKVDSTDITAIIESNEADFVQAITSYDADLAYKAIWKKAEALEITFGSEEIKTRLMDFMQIKGDA
jgi:foldase protein PrsA